MFSFGNTDKRVRDNFLKLDQPDDGIQVMYVWIDGTGEFMRAKTKTVTEEPKCAEDLPVWNYDGSSTGQAQGKNSDVYLKPVALFRDPMRRGPNKIVMCETYTHDDKPTGSNKRLSCLKVMEQAKDAKPWFGIEQEYLMLSPDLHPLGWPKSGYPGPQGPYHCGVGADRVYGRDVVEAHYRACMYAGIEIAGSNAETMPSQWEFQVGPCEGIAIGDQLWMARFLLHRIAEDFGVVVSFDPKPFTTGGWSGAGGHVNFSTLRMREDGGLKVIKENCEKLRAGHSEYVKICDPYLGKDTRRRLTGLHETSHIDNFTVGIADRTTSIRIPRQVYEDGKGYLEDRRPSSNVEPYQVTEAIVRATVL